MWEEGASTQVSLVSREQEVHAGCALGWYTAGLYVTHRLLAKSHDVRQGSSLAKLHHNLCTKDDGVTGRIWGVSLMIAVRHCSLEQRKRLGQWGTGTGTGTRGDVGSLT